MPITDPNLSVGDERDGFRVIKVVNGAAAKYIWSRIATTSITPTTGTASVLAWAPATAYVAGQTVTTAAGVWRRTADGTSGAAFDAAEQATWTLVANLVSGIEVDKTPATIPATVAALTTAVPPTNIPSSEVWTSIVGVPGDLQKAQVVAGVWTLITRPVNTADVTPTPIPADVTALETAVPAAGKPTGITWIAIVGSTGAFRQATVVNGAWQLGTSSGAAGSLMVGATNTTAGQSGLVPVPTAGQQHLVLRGDGTWGPAFAAWQPSIVYSAGAMVTANGSLWSRISAGLSGLTFDSNEQGGWTALGGSGAAATAMTGASSTAAGTAGSVPAAGIGTQDLAFHGDGTFKTVAPDWVASRAYSAGALAVSGGTLYRRLTAGTSAASFAADAANWLALGAAGAGLVGATAIAAGTAGSAPAPAIGAQDLFLAGDATYKTVAPDWQPGRAYSAQALVVNGNILYRRIAAGTSAGTFAADIGAWLSLGAPTGATFTGSTGAAAGLAGGVPIPLAGTQDLVLHGDGTFRGVAPDWATGVTYSAGALVVNAGALYRRITAGVSGATFAADLANWSMIGTPVAAMTGANATTAGTAGTAPIPAAASQDLFLAGDATFKGLAPDWVAARAYSAGALAVNGTTLYRRLAAGTSAATFATDAANWTALGATAAARVFLSNAAVIPAVNGQPTLAEITAAIGTNRDVLVYYNGTNVAATDPTHVFDVDSAGTVTLLRAPTAATAFTGSTALAAGVAGGVPAPAVATQDLALFADGSFRGVAPDWAAARAYSAGAVVVSGNRLWRRAAAGTSGASFDAAEQAAWTSMSASSNNRLHLTNAAVAPAVAGQPTNAEALAAVGTNRDVLAYFTGTNVSTDAPTHVWDVDASGTITLLRSPQTATAAMTAATSAVAGGGGTVPAPAAGMNDLFLAGDATYKAVAPDWVAAHAYSAGALAVNAGILYRRIAAGTAGATFDAAERATWLALGSAAPNRVHLTNALVAPAIVGQPTVAEATTAFGTTRDTIGFFTGTNVATDPVSHVFHIDGAGAVTVLEQPSAALTGATGVAAGAAGRAPAPAASQQGLFLRGDASWSAVIGAFAASTAYSAGAVIATTEGIWTRNAAGTSGLTFDAAEQANWTLRANMITDPLRFRGGWDATTAFPGAGTAQAGDYYRVTVAGTQGGETFAVGDSVFAIVDNASATVYPANWLRVAGAQINAMTGATALAAGTTGIVPAPAIGAQDMILFGDATWRGPIGDWAASRAYSAGAVIVNGRRIYRRLTAGTSTATFALDTANWVELGSVGGAVLADTATAVAETALTGMADGDVTFRTDTNVWRIYDADGAVWRDLSTPTAVMTGATALAAGTGGSTPVPAIGTQDLYLRADGTWSGLVPDWTASRAYSAGAIVTNNGTIYRRIAAGTSGATFDAAETATWTALTPATVAVVTQLTAASPTANRFNIYPFGATIGAAPTVVTGGEYTTAIMNAAGTGYTTVARFIERAGAWVAADATTATDLPLDFDLGLISWWPGNTVPSDAFIPASGGTFNDVDYPLLAAKIQAGGMAGFTKALNTFTVPDLNTTGRFIRGLGGRAAGTLQAGATAVNGLTVNTTIPVVNNETTSATNDIVYQGSGGNANKVYTAALTGDTETRPLNVSYLAVIRAKPFVTTIASGGTLTINNLIPAPKRTITVTVNGAAGTIRTAASWSGYEGQTAGIRVDIPAGHYISAAVGTQSSGTALTAGQVAITAAEAGLLVVTLGDGDMAIAVTTLSQTVAITANGAPLAPAVAAKINSTHTVRLPIPAGQEIDPATVLPATAIVSDIVTGAATVVVGTVAVDVVYSTRTRTTLTDVAQAGVYTWEVKSLSVAGGTANDFVAATTVGTAHALNPTNAALILQPGYTWEISAEVTRHGGNPGWTTHSLQIDGTNVGNPFYSGVSGTNWYGGGATTHIVTIPSTAASRAVRVHRTSSGGNGDTSGNLVVRAIAKEGNTTLPAAWPQRTITATIDGVAATFQTRASVTGYDNQTVVCDLDLAAGRSITSVTASSGVAEIVMGHAGLISVTPNGGNVSIVATTSAAATFTSWQRVTVVNPNLAVTASNQEIDMGVTLQEGDELRISHQFNGSTSEQQSARIMVKAGTAQRHAYWPDSGNIFHHTFPGTLNTAFSIRQNTAGSSPRILSVELWRNAANGYIVPTGFQAAVARSVSATINAVAANVDGATSATALEGVGKVIQITLGAGRRLATVAASGGATANIVDPIKGLVYVLVGAGDSVLTCTDSQAATYKGLQKVHPTYTPGGGLTAINNTTFTTNVDLTDPAIEQVTFHLADTDGKPWPSAPLRLKDARVNGDSYFVWNHDTAFVEITVSNHATGTFVMTDSVRGASLRAIDFEGHSDLGLVVPTATTVAAEVDITVNAGAVEIDGVLGAHKILTGVGAYHLTATLPAGKWVDAAAFVTANAAKGAKLIDRRTGEFSIQVPVGGAATDITMAFVDQQQTAAVLTLTGDMVTNDGVHNVTDLTAFAKIDNEGSGLVVGNDSTVTITRDAILACGLTIDSSEGSGLTLWPRISLDRNDGDGFFVVSEDTHTNPAAGAEQWHTSYGPFLARAGSKLRFDARVSGPYSGGRPGTIWIRELAADNGFVMPSGGGTLAVARNVTAVVDSVAAQIDGTAGVVAYQQIGKTIHLAIPVGRQLDTVSASGGAVVNVVDRMRGMVYIVAGTADSIITATTTLAATYSGLQKLTEWIPAGGEIDMENLVVNTGINLTLVDWLVVHYSDPGNDRPWPPMWLSLEGVVDNTDIWFNSRNVGYGRWQVRNRSAGQLWFEDDDGSIQINKIEAFALAENGFCIPTASTVLQGRQLIFNPGAQVVQGLEGVWQIVRLNSLASTDELTTVSATGGALVDIIDAKHGLIAVQPSTSNSTITATSGPANSDFIRVRGNQDLAGVPFVSTVGGSAGPEIITVAITTPGLHSFTVNCAGWDNDTGGNMAVRVDLLDASSSILDSDIAGLGGNHPGSQWVFLGVATLRANLPVAGNYRVRIQATASELDGMACTGLIVRRGF